MAEQAQRQLSITSPLGKDVLLLTAFQGEEGLSTPFRFTLQLLSEKRDIKPEDLVGKKVTFSIKLADAKERFFHGYVSRLRAGRGDTRYRQYTAEVVSWLGLLAHTSDCKIFQNKSVIEIIEAVFGDHKFAEFKTDHVSKRGPTAVLDRKLEYCVQYRESDLNFVTRLMEENGVHYYFTHEDGKHTLVLTDSKNNYPWCTEKEVEYVAGTTGTASKDGISEWEHDWEIRPSAWAYSDYDFKNPKTKQLSTVGTLPSNNLPGRPSELELEVFDYPGDYVKPAEGKQLVELRMGEEEARYNTVTGASACRSFVTGGKFKLKDPDQPDEDGKTYVLSKVSHEATEPAEYESGAGGAGLVYQNRFECIPDSLDFRPPRVARRPFVQGPQTAVVCGPAGADVYPDEYGRVKVQFFWDRYGKNDESSSCWLRVSQTWAGNGWGSMHIPWVGQEVIVDFLEGNPDRPLITGRVYNADQKVPLALPGNKYKNVVARDEYGNEIIFHHDAGDEHISIHSPHHNSTLELGRSVTLNTSSDNTTTTIGNAWTNTYGHIVNMEYGTESKVVVGGYHQVVVGGMIDGWVGAKLAFNIGAITNVTLAGIFDFNVGYSISYRKAKQLELNDDGFVKSTGKNIVMDSDAEIGLLGGSNDASIAKLSKKELVLSYWDGSSDRRFAGQHAKTKTCIGVALTFATGLMGEIAGVSNAFAQAKVLADQYGDKTTGAMTDADAKAKAEAEIKEAKAYNAEQLRDLGSKAAKFAGLSLASVAGLAALLGTPPDKPFDHKSPDARIKMFKGGILISAGAKHKPIGYLKIDNMTKVALKSEKGGNHVILTDNGKMGLKTPKEIQVECKDFWVRSGSISHRNVTVRE